MLFSNAGLDFDYLRGYDLLVTLLAELCMVLLITVDFGFTETAKQPY
jgi:hypothetical protein